MARNVDVDAESRTERVPRRARKQVSWLKRFLILGLIGFALLVVFLPQILTSRSLLVGAINRFGGLAPMRVDMESVEAGWFAPVSAHGIRVTDAAGQVLVQVKDVVTQKGLIGWISNSADLGTIQIDGVEAVVVAHDGTTNIEEALTELITPANEGEDEPIGESALPTGTIELSNAKVLLVEQGRPEQWIVQVSKMLVALPKDNQLIGPIELQASIGDTSGTVANSIGQMAANARQLDDGSVEFRAKLDNFAVDLLHVVKARLPELPIESMSGRLSATIAGKALDAEHWTFDVQQLQSRDFVMVAPDLVGESPAQLRVVDAAGRVALSDSVFRVDGAQIACDVGTATASASLAWPITIPTAADPFLAGGTVSAQGTLDLPKLSVAMQSLLPVRENTELQAGNAQFAFSQTLADDQRSPVSVAKLTLSGLKARAAGQELSWDEPLSVQLGAQRSPSGLQFDVGASAEFCNLTGGGTIQNGSLKGNVDLDLLQQRLSQFIELPIANMTGAAQLDMAWQMNPQEQVVAQGHLETTPLVIATSIGNEMREPAWRGDFSGTVQLRQGTPTHVNQIHVDLNATDEKLAIDLQEPVALSGPAPGAPVLPPAAFAVSINGDLGHWKRRGIVWLTDAPEFDIAGKMNVAVSGKIDLSHLEILQANWSTQPLQVSMTGFNFAESQMVGSFLGRVDTNDLTRLQVEKLQVQANSFSLLAQDAAAPDSDGRVGQATFLIDLQRLLSNMNAVAKQPEPGVEPTTSYSATGRLQGQMKWQVTATGAALALQSVGNQLVLLSQAPGAIAATPMWSEPTLTAGLNGTWTSASGAVDLETLMLETPWLNYQGKLTYRSSETTQDVTLNGQAVYDAAQLSEKLAPMTGNQVQLAGSQTVPIDVQWHSDTNAPEGTSALAGLKASTRIGWEQARVVGIEVGKADVPVTINAGQLATAAEIPVSGGVLRWDVTSDLTQELLVIYQQPMTVLENVEITEEMCSGWLKYVAPLVAEATSVDGRLSLTLSRAELTPTDPRRQTVVGQLVMHKAEVGPGPLSNQVIGLVKQIDAIRKKDFTQSVSTQKVWMQLPEQQIDFQMVEGKVIHRNLNVRVGDANISTAGAVDVSGQMEMLATMPIPDDWIDKAPLLAGLRGQSLQFPMRGTLSKPQVDTALLEQLGRQTIQNAASGLLQQGISKGLEKLFK